MPFQSGTFSAARLDHALSKRDFFRVVLGGTIRKFALIAFVFALQLGAVTNLWAADPRVGSWTLVSAQSAVEPANTLSIKTVHDEVEVVMTGQTRLNIKANKDGHESFVPGNPAFNQIQLRRIDKRQTEATEKKDGVLVATVRNKVSSDGNELTIATASKGHPEQVTVWARTGGAKAHGDPFSGEWTQDLSKTRLRQGLLLKIDAEGDGGVHFSGDFSYTARFDGKAYDLRDSRNDTVTLQLVDAHTVDSIYRREDRQTEKDRWVVSADGQHLTVTTAGQLETGQRITEKLVFKKQ